MDWLTFISSLVGSVAWPIAAFAIAFLFRAQIRRLINRIKRLSVGDNSVDFSEKLDEVEADAGAGAGAAAPAANAPLLPDQRTQQLIALSPAAAVLDSWRAVERKTLSLAQSFFSTEATYRDGRPIIAFRQAVKALFKRGMISGNTYALLFDLQQLRNQAAHNEDVSAADAVRFTTLAAEALRFLDGPDVVPDNPETADPAAPKTD